MIYYEIFRRLKAEQFTPSLRFLCLLSGFGYNDASAVAAAATTADAH